MIRFAVERLQASRAFVGSLFVFDVFADDSLEKDKEIAFNARHTGN
jgi:hypothetical protein